MRPFVVILSLLVSSAWGRESCSTLNCWQCVASKHSVWFGFRQFGIQFNNIDQEYELEIIRTVQDYKGCSVDCKYYKLVHTSSMKCEKYCRIPIFYFSWSRLCSPR
jgi:hypothetical protein